MRASCDIAIIGGGPAGTALALALRDSGLNIYLLEARMAGMAVSDTRALALSYGSRLLLTRLGVWDEMAQVSPIRTIHISQKNTFGRAILRATELRVPELGYVLPYAALQDKLQTALRASSIMNLTGAVVTQLEQGADEAIINYRHEGNEHELNARLAVVADGGKLLEATHPPKMHDYGQSAIIAHVDCAHMLEDTAFERFTVQGPVALLPFGQGYELVWTVLHETAQEMLQWKDEVFLAQLQLYFGDRVGEFSSVGKRTCFPLRSKHAPAAIYSHTILIGNAAQTLHPVAGQGLNLGLRDAWELAQMVIDCAPEALGSEAMLTAYRKRRAFDRRAGSRFTDGLVRLFSKDLPLLNSSRGLALSVLDCLPGVKRFVARRMMLGANG